MGDQPDDQSSGSSPNGHEVTITLNKKPIIVVGPRVNGAQIKQAGIDQGREIELSFTLSEQRPNGRWENVADDQVVTVNKNSVFMATDDDDDS